MSTFYTVERKLGEGSFAQVFLLCGDPDRTRAYAMKVIDKDRFNEEEQSKCVQEAKLMRKLRHTNIVACYDAFEFESHLLLVTEYCPAGDMYCYLESRRDATPRLPVEESRISVWVLQIAMALQYLHERKILHRDLKTKNIFLTEDLTVKIGDLGIAKQLDFTLAQAETFLGTPLYMSPEIFQFQPYSYKADIWSFGCCVYEMMTLRFAFESPSQHKMVQRILKGEAPSCPTSYGESLCQLTQQMLNKDPQDRPRAADIALQLQQDQPQTGNSRSSPRSRRRSSQTQVVTDLPDQPQTGNSRSSPRSRRRSSQTQVVTDLPDLTSSLRSDRHLIADSLMVYFKDNVASGLGSGFDVNVLATKSRLSRSVKSIWTRSPSQEETTLFTRQFGTGLRDEIDSVDNIGYGKDSSQLDTVKRSPRKSDHRKKSPPINDSNLGCSVDNSEDCHNKLQNPDDVMKWARDNLVSCKPPLVPEKDSKMKTKKKRSFLRAVSERHKSVDKTETPKQRSSSTTSGVNGALPVNSSSIVTLFTRSQKVVFQNKEFIAGDTITKSCDTSNDDDRTSPDIKRSCESALGMEMLTRARQLAAIVNDEKLLQAQLQDLIGWRNYRKYGSYIIRSSRPP